MIKLHSNKLRTDGVILVEMTAGDFDALHRDVRCAQQYWKDNPVSPLFAAITEDTDRNLEELDLTLAEIKKTF